MVTKDPSAFQIPGKISTRGLKTDLHQWGTEGLDSTRYHDPNKLIFTN